MGLTVNRQMAEKLTVNRQKRNIFTVNRQMSEPKESLSMTFTADGKRQRLPLIFYCFLVILK